MDIHILCDLILAITSENWVGTAELTGIIRDNYNSCLSYKDLTLKSAFCFYNGETGKSDGFQTS